VVLAIAQRLFARAQAPVRLGDGHPLGRHLLPLLFQPAQVIVDPGEVIG
jgi:hypothetical protein